MAKISESEFARICEGIDRDRESICKHNPIGTDDEIVLWMVLNCLVSYLSLTELETPCFNGKATVQTYRDAIHFVLRDRRTEDFDPESFLEKILKGAAESEK